MQMCVQRSGWEQRYQPDLVWILTVVWPWASCLTCLRLALLHSGDNKRVTILVFLHTVSKITQVPLVQSLASSQSIKEKLHSITVNINKGERGVRSWKPGASQTRWPLPSQAWCGALRVRQLQERAAEQGQGHGCGQGLPHVGTSVAEVTRKAPHPRINWQRKGKRAWFSTNPLLDSHEARYSGSEIWLVCC